MNEICGCGRPLVAVLNSDGKKIGVTHETIEDEEYHLGYFASLIPIEAPQNESDN